MIKLDQFFYGRDSVKGYRLLASSNSAHNQVVERLCAAVGTPDGMSKMEPFYINHIENGYRYMISVCAGTSDDNGRETLFFHAYAGQHQELIQAGFGIGNLIQENAFSNSYKNGPVLPASFEETTSSLPWGTTPIVWDKQNLAIQSSKPELPIITGLLKNEIDNVSWASFSFRPLDFCRIYIVSEYVMMPQDRKCVSTEGKTLNSQRKKEISNPSNANNISVSPKSMSFRIPFLISVIVNVVLACFCFLGAPGTITTRGQSSPPDSEHVNIIKEEKDLVTREEVIKELREEFEKRIIHQSTQEWMDLITHDKVLKDQYMKYKKTPLLYAESCIQFINQTLYREKEGTIP